MLELRESKFIAIIISIFTNVNDGHKNEQTGNISRKMKKTKINKCKF